MGAGASTAGKGKKSVPSGAKALSTAAGSASEAKALFEKLDSNKDGRLSQADLREAVKKHGKDIKSDWSDELIGELFGFFDLDGDGLLDLEEFTSVLAEVKARGGRLDANDLKAQVARRVEEAERRAGIEKVWNRLVKEGNVWDKGCSGKLIRELNEENLWDDFGAKVTTWHAELCADESKKATANLEQFVAAYPRLLAETAEIRATWAREAEERTQAAAQAKAEEFLASKPEWEVPLKRLNEATAAAWAVGKTPLLVDMTTLKGDDRTAVFSPLETFFSYSGDVLIELKKAIVELSVKKEKSLEQLHDEFARKLLMGIKQGRSLVLLCSNSAPPITSKFVHPDRFPKELFDAAALKACLGSDAKLEDTFLSGLLRFMNESGLKHDPSYNLVFGHPDFRVMLVTKFEPADYRGFLEGEVDFEQLQPIKVIVEE